MQRREEVQRLWPGHCRTLAAVLVSALIRGIRGFGNLSEGAVQRHPAVNRAAGFAEVDLGAVEIEAAIRLITDFG